MSRLQRMVDRINVADLAGQSKEDFWAFAYETGTGVIKGLIEEVLEIEMDDFVGARWHERGRAARWTTRAGYRSRRLTVLGGDVALRMPRARTGGFRSAFLVFRGRREKAFDEAVVGAYVAGASMRETTAFLQEVFGTSVSPTTVSKLVRRMDAQREAFHRRPLDDVYDYVVLDAMYAHCAVGPAPLLRGARGGEAVEKVAVLMARGIRADGTRELIDYSLAVGEREGAWEGFLRGLYDRGMEGEGTDLFIHDGSEGLENALDSVYGAVRTQRCVCHKLANVWDAVEDKTKHRRIRRDAASVYDVKDEKEAWDRLAWFGRRWRRREPAAVDILRSDFDRTLRFLGVPEEHRRWITTTNPLERYIREVRRRTRPMGCFQGLDSADRLIFVAVYKLSNERRNRIPYSLWVTQPWTNSRKRRRARAAAADIAQLRRQIIKSLEEGLQLPHRTVGGPHQPTAHLT